MLRDALWHDMGMAVRSQRRVGHFRDSIGGSMCLVVDAEVLGEPDPDPARVLEVGWFTRVQVDVLDGAGLLAGGFVPAALDCAQEQRKQTRLVAVRHLADGLRAWVRGARDPGPPDGVLVAGAPTPPGRTCWACSLYSQHKPWCPAR